MTIAYVVAAVNEDSRPLPFILIDAVSPTSGIVLSSQKTDRNGAAFFTGLTNAVIFRPRVRRVSGKVGDKSFTGEVRLQTINITDSAAVGVTDHGALTGLGDDDHPQYETSAEAQAKVDTHTADTSDAHDASAISILDTAADFTATDVEGALAELQSDAEAHLADTSDAHDASAISILDTAADFTATDVEGALAELQSDNEAHVAAADPHTGYVPESLVDAKGDLIAASADNVVGRLPVSTDAFILIGDAASSLGLKWVSPLTIRKPVVKARPSGTQTISTGTATALTWTAADDYDTNTMHSTSTNPTRITINTAGVYRFTTAFHFSTSSLGTERICWFDVNGAGVFWSSIFQPPLPASREHGMVNTFEIKLSINDFVEVKVQHDAGVDLTVNSNGGFLSFFSAAWVSEGV